MVAGGMCVVAGGMRVVAGGMRVVAGEGGVVTCGVVDIDKEELTRPILKLAPLRHLLLELPPAKRRSSACMWSAVRLVCWQRSYGGAVLDLGCCGVGQRRRPTGYPLLGCAHLRLHRSLLRRRVFTCRSLHRSALLVRLPLPLSCTAVRTARRALHGAALRRILSVQSTRHRGGTLSERLRCLLSAACSSLRRLLPRV